jgi:hypothetical protein
MNPVAVQDSSLPQETWPQPFLARRRLGQLHLGTIVATIVSRMTLRTTQCRQ